MPIVRHTTLVLAGGLGFLLSSCNYGGDGGFRPTPNAVQIEYRAGVPHTDRVGRRRLAVDANSFFPIGIYHGLAGTRYGRHYDFASFAAVGINTVFAWGGQPLNEVLAAAGRDQMQIVYPDPRPEAVPQAVGDRAMLAWEVDHEPSLSPPDENSGMRLENFIFHRGQIQATDPIHPVLVVNSPSVTPPRLEVWEAWSRTADIAAFWKYPFVGRSIDSLSGPRGIPEVVSRAVSVNREQKPVWYVAQAFASPDEPDLDEHWRMPSEIEARAMVFAALVHGATGIVWFAYDSFVTRNGDVLGAAPAPERDYGIILPGVAKPPLIATNSERAASRRMWETIGRIDREMIGLQSILLSPTAVEPYWVAVQGDSASETPIRTLLKRDGSAFVLIAVNIDNRNLVARFSFDHAIHDLRGVDGAAANFAAISTEWTERFPPFGVRIYRFNMDLNGPAHKERG